MITGYKSQSGPDRIFGWNDEGIILDNRGWGHEKPTHFTLGAEMSKREIAMEGLKTVCLFVQMTGLVILGFFFGV
jgi:hypothetical protein